MELNSAYIMLVLNVYPTYSMDLHYRRRSFHLDQVGLIRESIHSMIERCDPSVVHLSDESMTSGRDTYHGLEATHCLA